MDENKLEEAMAETVEQSFNDSELEDIMSEIENLEKEFVEDGEKSPKDLSLTEAPTSELQDEIDKEVETISDEMSPEAEAPVEMSSEEAPAEIVSEAEVTDAEIESIEAEIDAEVESIEVVEVAAVAEEPEEVAVEEVSNVVSLPVSEKITSSGANMDFSASGSMDLNLNFKIGSETATLKVDGNKGLIVEMGGVEIQITESEGCTVTMEGGVNFNIPLTTSGESSKKKAA